MDPCAEVIARARVCSPRALAVGVVDVLAAPGVDPGVDPGLGPAVVGPAGGVTPPSPTLTPPSVPAPPPRLSAEGDSTSLSTPLEAAPLPAEGAQGDGVWHVAAASAGPVGGLVAAAVVRPAGISGMISEEEPMAAWAGGWLLPRLLPSDAERARYCWRCEARRGVREGRRSAVMGGLVRRREGESERREV